MSAYTEHTTLCTKMAAVSSGTSHVTTKQHFKYTSVGTQKCTTQTKTHLGTQKHSTNKKTLCKRYSHSFSHARLEHSESVLIYKSSESVHLSYQAKCRTVPLKAAVHHLKAPASLHTLLGLCWQRVSLQDLPEVLQRLLNVPLFFVAETPHTLFFQCCSFCLQFPTSWNSTQSVDHCI